MKQCIELVSNNWVRLTFTFKYRGLVPNSKLKFNMKFKKILNDQSMLIISNLHLSLSLYIYIYISSAIGIGRQGKGELTKELGS